MILVNYSSGWFTHKRVKRQTVLEGKKELGRAGLAQAGLGQAGLGRAGLGWAKLRRDGQPLSQKKKWWFKKHARITHC